jgi:hypothetical protein
MPPELAVALIKHRPKIRLRLPRTVKPGQRVEADVVIDAKREVPVEHITATVRGEERARWSTGSGDSRRTYSASREVLFTGARLCAARTLPQGRSEFPYVFELPADVPASYDSRGPAKVEYSIDLRVSIDWWPDAKATFEMLVEPRDTVYAPERLLTSTRPDGPSAREAHLETSLSSRTLQPGGTVEGAVALSNVADNDYRGIGVSLVGVETAWARGKEWVGEVFRYGIHLPVRAPSEGATIPFKFQLPDEVPPTYDSPLWRLRWHMEVKADIAWARDLKLTSPVEVVPQGSQPTAKTRSHFAAPTVGNERIRAVWQSVADLRGLTFEDDRLEGSRGNVDIVVARHHRGQAGVFLEARLAYPDLHLDITCAPKKGLQWVLKGRDVHLGDRDWDRRHHLAGRDAAQVRAFVSPMLHVLRALGTTRFDDRELTIDFRSAGGTKKPVDFVARAAVALAELLPRARAAIPPPEAMMEAHPRWEQLAARLTGHLETARMAISGRFRGFECAVVTEWIPEGDPIRTVARIQTGFPIDEKHHLTWAGTKARTGDPSRLDEEARMLTEHITKNALGLTIDEQAIELYLEAPLLQPESVLEHLDLLARLTAALREKAGPYR